MSKLFGLAAITLTLAITSTAAAQSPTQDAYGGAGGQVIQVAPGGDTGLSPYTPPNQTAEGGVLGEQVSGSSTPTKGTSTPAGGVLGERASGGSTPSSGTAGVSASSLPTTGTAAGTQPIATTGRLPFTGMDLGLLATGSLLLVALGFGLRRLGRPAPLA